MKSEFQPTDNEPSNNEITIRELFLKSKELGKEVWLRKWWILITMLFVSGIMFLNVYFQPVEYKGEITFMTGGGDGGGRSGINSLLGQVGFGGDKNTPNPYTIMDLSRSRIITQKALFEKATINDRHDFIANHIIFEYDYHKGWDEEDSKLKDFVFTHDTVSQFELIENRVLTLLHRKLINQERGLLETSFNELSSIVTFSIQTTSEELSATLVKIIFHELRHFYISQKTENQTKTYELFKAKTDSIERALNSTQYQLYRFQDFNRNLSLQQYSIEQTKLQQEVQKLMIAYGESYKSQEVADFNLRNQKPALQIIDEPLMPLSRIALSKSKTILIGLFLGGFISITIIILLKIVRDAIKE